MCNSRSAPHHSVVCQNAEVSIGNETVSYHHEIDPTTDSVCLWWEYARSVPAIVSWLYKLCIYVPQTPLLVPFCDKSYIRECRSCDPVRGQRLMYSDHLLLWE